MTMPHDTPASQQTLPLDDSNPENPESGALPRDDDYYRRLMDRLFSILSHDLRTPLSAISGWLFLLESEKLDPAGRKRALEKIRSNVDQEVKMIDDTLLLARCKAGTINLDMTLVDVRTVLRSALETAQPAAAAKNVPMQSRIADSDPSGFVKADMPRLKRAFELVLDHALRNTSGADAMISIDAVIRVDAILISIADNGRGIAPAALPYVFDPFGAPPAAAGGQRHGAERGLLVAAALIEAHHGHLRVASPGPGHGSTFTVELQAAAPPETR